MKKVSKESILYIIPLVFIIALVPMIVLLKVITLDDITTQLWTGKDNADFFSYYKSTLIMAFSALSLIAFLYARNKNSIEIKKLNILYIPMAIYGLLVILSTVYSKYPITAKSGFADRYEGVFVLLSYLVILFTTINLINSQKAIRLMTAALFISAVIIGTIGIFQFFGMDLFRSSFGKELILPPAYKNTSLDFAFGPYTIYTTLYNTNYVGSYMAILFPLSIAAFMYVKKPYMKIGAALLSCLMFANFVGCRSRAGYLGGAAAMLILIILMWKVFIKNIKTVIPLFLSFVLIFVGMDSYAHGQLSGRVRTTLAGQTTQTQKIPKVVLKDIVVSGKKVSIITDKNTMNLELKDNSLSFSDSQGKNLIYVDDGSGKLGFSEKGYEPYKAKFDSQNNLLTLNINSATVVFYIRQNGFCIVGERNILLTQFDHPESFGFEGNERFASGRGYIWSRSIPLLKNDILLGGGPDTFAMQFPQHDYVGKLKGLDRINLIVDKPHNMYLQIGINTGVVSLVALLFLFIVYIFTSLRLYIGNKNNDEGIYIGTAVLSSVIGYLVSGVFNDSLVSVAPVFWTILGIGISLNYMLSKGSFIPAAVKTATAAGVSGKAGSRTLSGSGRTTSGKHGKR